MKGYKMQTETEIKFCTVQYILSTYSKDIQYEQHWELRQLFRIKKMTYRFGEEYINNKVKIKEN